MGKVWSQGYKQTWDLELHILQPGSAGAFRGSSGACQSQPPGQRGTAQARAGSARRTGGCARERGIPSDVIARIPNKHWAALAELLIWLIASQELRGGRGGIPSREAPQNAALGTPETPRVTLWAGGRYTRPWGAPQGAQPAERESLGGLYMELRVTQQGGRVPEHKFGPAAPGFIHKTGAATPGTRGAGACWI